jgi:alkylresorcinol/alkylpyrone synthase
MTAMLERMDTPRPAVDRFVCHPGGTKVVSALETALALPAGVLDHERAVLADYGNMSSPTVLFVLQRVLAAGAPASMVLTAMGPGFSCAAVSLRAA